MPTIFPARRNSHADVGARFRRHGRSTISRERVTRRIIAFVLIATLAFPIFVAGPRQTEAARTSPISASTIALPQPFILHKAETRAVASVFTNTKGILENLVATPTLPAGFESAKLPTQTERLAGLMQPVLALITSTKSAISNPNSQIAPPPPAGTVLFDFDGDGKADIGRWHSSNTEFKVRNSGDASYSTHTIGSSSSVPAPGDFDGDGITDAAVFNAGAWTIKKSSNGSTQNISFGTTGDVPVAADYDGDGVTDAAVFRPSTNVWWVLRSSDSNYTSTSHGTSGDIPVTGNWDNDSYADFAVFRPSTGNWYVLRSTAGSLQVAWGLSTDVPVPADFDGDNKTDIAVYRPSTGAWWVMKSSTGFDGTYQTHNWGNYGDQPVPADYDGDGKADYAVWRPKTGVWYISKSSSNNTTYEYHGLGVTGDRAVPSAYIKQVATTVYGDDMALTRLSPKNATGGTNLYSQNFSWGTQLVGLPGRSGLDAGFGIGYNSLVWTKLGSDIHFDVDQGNVSPGFRFGFPAIEPAYYNDTTEKWNFLMVTPSGARVEFRQTAVSNIYETADSSYTQLKIKGAQSVTDPVEDIGIEVTTTDGTVLTYEWLGGAYRCSQIKDRNGNYITIDHDEYGTLRTVTDTLGRVITVNYDSQLYPTSITQTWKTNNGEGSNVTHTWVSFTYANTGDDSTTPAVDTNFSSLTVVGPADNTTIKVLKQISYADGSYTRFTYNSYVQVTKVENFAADDHLLNHIRTNLDNITTAQTDCPRFTATYTKVDNFNLSGSGVPQEIEVTNSLTTGSSYSLPGSLTGNAAKIEVAMTGHPDGLYSRMYVGESGWKEGLTLATEDCIGTNCSDRKRWTWTDWTQDDENVGYILNPRVEESRVGDGTNTKRSTIEYWLNTGTTVAVFGLVKSAFVYDTDLSTVLKKTYSTYNLDSAYTSRRIIGLPSLTEYYGRETTGLNLMSKVSYAYDEGNFSDTGLQQSISPVQHDGTGYGSSFITGRGNLTSTTRWNVEYPTNSGYAVTSSVKYNTAGSVVSQTDPVGRLAKVLYADEWNSTGNPSTYAYPTTLTDANGNSSNIKYRYDIGANVEATSPVPHGSTYGKKTKRVYDSIGRLQRNSVYLNTTEYTYTRYEYPANGIQSQMYTTIADADGDTYVDDDEALTETWSDGAGRVIASRAPHPGSTGGWAATRAEYDILGRLKKQTVPTEISVSGTTWTPTGDDSAWRWSERQYDWMGRVTRMIPVDSNGTDGKDTLYEYAGCGCAGGLVTTVKGPVTTAVDVSGTTQTTKRRVQKMYEDILGRTYKTEIWDLDGAGSAPYSTTHLTFNGRDQVTLSRQYSGGTSSSTYQDTTSTFDGHGRLLTRHNPIEDASTNTSWTYNVDDTVATVTDPRGAVTTFSYGNPSISEKRALLIGIAYSVPSGSGIPDPADVSFVYDSVGNRKQMTDGSGVLDYEFDFLSRLTEESKQFADDLDNEPVGGYRLEYTYHVGGGIKSIESPFGETVTYTVDKAGRTTAMPASGFGNQSSFTSGISYRAFGGIKAMTYSTTSATNITLGYDAGLRLTTYEAESSANTTDIHNKTYSYYNDGSIKEADNNVDANYTQAYEHDFIGRLRKNEVNDPAPGGPAAPYTQTLGYDAFNNITSRATTIDGQTQRSFTAGYTNHRRTSGGFGDGVNTWDAAGNVTYNRRSSAPIDQRNWKFDAAGRMTDWLETSQYAGTTLHDQGEELTFDGDGRVAKRLKKRRIWANPPNSFIEEPEYYIYSSVTGQKITELKEEGDLNKTNVYLGSTLIAEYSQAFGLVFKHTDPVAGNVMQTESSGAITPNDVGRLEFEALGAVVPTTEPELEEPYRYSQGGSVANPEYGCVVDHILQPGPSACTEHLRSGTGVRCPNDDCDSRVVRDRQGRERFTFPYSCPGGVCGWLVPGDPNKRKPPTLQQISREEQRRRKRAYEQAGYIPDPDDIEREYLPIDEKGIERGIELVWANTDCRDLITGLLNAVSSRRNPLEGGGDLIVLFRRLMQQGGITRKPPAHGLMRGGTVSGRFADGDATVHIPNSGDPTRYALLKHDIAAVVAELPHLAGRNQYTDRDFARAVRNNPQWAASNSRDNVNKTPQVFFEDDPNLTPAQKAVGRRDTAMYSGYWHPVITNLCLSKVDFSSLR